jgi:hypothetical protein
MQKTAHPLAIAQMVFLAASILVFAALTVPIAADGDWYLLWFTVPAALLMGIALMLEIRDRLWRRA